MLQEEGAGDITAATRDGMSPLHYAAEGGHAEAITVLLSAGAVLEATDSFGRTPLQLAVEGVHHYEALSKFTVSC